MTWEQVHRRNRVVRDIVERAADGQLPLSADDREAIEAEFSAFDDFLLQVHALWARAFDARVDSVLECRPLDRTAAVADVCAGLADDLPGVRRVLDEHADAPLLRRAVVRHERLVRDATGVDLAGLAVRSSRQRQPVPACTVRRRLNAVRVSLGVAR
ncbi:MAG: hypothetical protein ACRDO7_15615 [Nocardioidaceae bacterium]